MNAMISAARSDVCETGPAIKRLSVAFGPKTPGWGSWDWLGEDLSTSLGQWFDTQCFEWNAVPECEVVVVVKHPLPERLWMGLDPGTRVIYCPVDHYGSAAEIDADRAWLSRCAQIIVHCERLRKYFAPYAPVEFLEHHVKYVVPFGDCRPHPPWPPLTK